MHHKADDIAIIQMVLKGNQSAYTTLVARYQGYVFTITMRYVNNREVAEELAQDVFIKAYKNLADFKGNSKFSTWLYTIVHTTCLSHLRKKQHAAILPGDAAINYIADGHALAQQPINNMEVRDRQATLEQAIQKLPPAEAEVITLYYLAEQTVEETGIITGMTPGNVKVRLYRARQKLKEILTVKRFDSVH